MNTFEKECMRPLGGLKIGLQHKALSSSASHNAFGENGIQTKSRFSPIEVWRHEGKFKYLGEGGEVLTINRNYRISLISIHRN